MILSVVFYFSKLIDARSRAFWQSLRRVFFETRSIAKKCFACTWHSGASVLFTHQFTRHRSTVKNNVTRQSFDVDLSVGGQQKTAVSTVGEETDSRFPPSPQPSADVYITAACLISASNRANKPKERGCRDLLIPFHRLDDCFTVILRLHSASKIRLLFFSHKILFDHRYYVLRYFAKVGLFLYIFVDSII